MDTATIISIAISIAAFILSSVALWQTHFAKFKLVNTVGNLQIKIYSLKNKKEKWYLPTIDIPISLTNEGARVGNVLGLRVLARFPDLPAPNNYKIINPLCEVDYKKFEAISNKNLEWIDEAILGKWMPFIVLPKQTITKHLVFRSRWDKVIIQEKVNFELEMYTSTKRKWRKVAEWEACLTPEMWSETKSKVSSFIFIEADLEKLNLGVENNLAS